jgi:hypothetical protein
MSANPKHPCTLCGNAGHQASRCKELGVPPDGFYKPSPGMHQGDDDCDESLKRNLPLKPMHTIWLNQLLSGPRIKRLF